MRYYFAPLEGLTDSIYRRLHHSFFPGIDRYYTPFLSPTMHRALTPKEERELPLADTLGYEAVPQLLTKNAEDFLWMCSQCVDRGYREINLNLGCPSGTVTAKGKGSGMLKDLGELDRFLDTVFYKAPLDISVKTRLGFSDPGEFEQLLPIFNRYPIKELIIHPRVRAQFYKGPVDMKAFDYAAEHSKNPLCYNGNLCSLSQIDTLSKTYPEIHSVMLGRALIADPGLLTPGGSTAQSLEAFHNALLDEYIEKFGSARNAMFRMKENWGFLHSRFEGSDKLWKALRKTTDVAEFKSICAQMLHTCPFSGSPD